MSNIKHWNIAARGIAFDPETGENFQINDSAKLILNLAREGLSPEEITQQVTKTFGISYERALTDVFEFLAQLDAMSSPT